MSSRFGLKNIADKVNGLESKQEFNLRNIDIEYLVPSEKNLYGIRDVEDLAEDIKQNGLYHNLVVRKLDDEKYEIISGERRYHALKILGVKKIPCQVREMDDVDSEIMLIQANAKTRELTDSEKMQQIARLEKLYNAKRKSGEKVEGKTRDVIGQDLGLSGVQVGRYQKINKDLIPELKQMLDESKISMSKAASLAALDIDGQMSVCELLKENNELSREELNEIKNRLKQREEEMEKEKEDYKKGLESEAKKISKMYEDFNKDYEKGLNENTKGVHGEHLDMKNIEFNARLEVLLREVKMSLRRVIELTMDNGENISDENKKALKELSSKETAYIVNLEL